MSQFHLQIVTPDGSLFDGMADSLLVRTSSGDVEFMRGHIDYFASLGIGLCKLRVLGETRYASLQGGFVSVKGGEVKLVATTFEFDCDIDLERAKKAREIAESKIADAKDEKTVELAKAKLLRAINRIKVAELYKDR